MTDFPWEIAALALLLGVNRFAGTLPAVLFWVVQAVDVGAAIYLAVVGIPGLQEYPVAGWLVAALIGFHFVQNFAVRERARIRGKRPRHPARQNLFEDDGGPPGA